MRQSGFVLAVALLTFGAGCSREVRFPAGVTAPRAPRQESLQKLPVFVRGDFIVRPVARFEIDARVLGRERYRFGRSARISPVDLALGWGPMSDQAVIDQVDIMQSRRFYWWSVDRLPVPRRQIIENSANMHMIPADDKRREELLAISVGSLITLSGYLVNVSTTDGFTWRTSTTRKDAGAGACEIVWVERVNVRNVAAG